MSRSENESSATRSPGVAWPVLGCIADDITGASDLADALARKGLATVLLFGVPSTSWTPPNPCDAVVVALKFRTAPVEQAVGQAQNTARWMAEQGIGRIYLKYCSTFDSTAAGNIGPVADTLAEMQLDGATVVHSPAYPVNDRTLYQGYLFVGEQLLSESGMRDHPLTPMRDANLVRVLAEQTPASVDLLALQCVRAGQSGIAQRLSDLAAAGTRHVLADAIVDDDLTRIAAAVTDQSLAAGGAAFGAAWGAALVPGATRREGPTPAAPSGYAAILVGSASTATAGQVAAFETNGPVLRLTPELLASGQDGIRDALHWASDRLANGPVMIAADSSPEAIENNRARFGAQEAGDVVESTLARLAVGLRDLGVARLIVAGGESSGAVAAALELSDLQVGPSISPGVPWMVRTGGDLAVAFKSGNFGGQNFFDDALASFKTDQWTHR